MKFSAPILLASSLAAAPLASAWSCGPGGYGVFITPGVGTNTMASFNAPSEIRRRQREMLSRQEEFFDRANPRKSVRYQIFDNENEFKVALDVPGVLAEDIDVGVEDDGTILAISGEREKMTGSGDTYRVQFAQNFAIDDEAINVDKFSANLRNGVLVVTAPKDLQRIQENIRKIPVFAEEEENDGDASSDGVIDMKENDADATATSSETAAPSEDTSGTDDAENVPDGSNNGGSTE